MKKIQITAIALMALMTLCTVSAASATTFEEKKMVVKENEEFKIELPDISGSTGYTWTREYDLNYLKLIDEYKFSNPNTNHEIEKPMPGAPGVIKYKFKALKTGQTKIVFTESRPWSNEMPSKVITYTITIK